MSCYRFDAERGIVFGLRGEPITKRSGGGYIQVNRGGKPIGMAHRMIWEHFNGPIPTGLQINHINGIKTDNRLRNLELVTPAENTQHAYRTGLASAKGTRNGRSKLSDLMVREIRASNDKARVLAGRYGVALSTIYAVISGKNWRQI